MSEKLIILRDKLPKELRYRLKAPEEPVVIRNHPESNPDRSWRWPLMPIVAIAVFGALTAALLPAPPFSQITSVALFLGAGALGALLGASRLRSLRPPSGQRLMVGTSSLSLIHHDYVEVLRGEDLEIAGQRILYRGQEFDRGGHDPVWTASLQTAIDAAANKQPDTWRRAAKPQTVPSSTQRKRIATGAAIALVLALGIEVAPLSSASQARWPKLGDRFESHVQWMTIREKALHKKVRSEFDERLPLVTTAMGAITVLLDVQARGLGDDFEGPTKQKLHELALVELAAAESADTVEPLLRMALVEQLPASFLALAKVRYAEIIGVEMQANPTHEAINGMLGKARRFKLGDAQWASLVTQVTSMGRVVLDSAKKPEEVGSYLSLCLSHELSETFCAETQEKYTKLALKRLKSSSIDEKHFTEIETLVARANLGDPLEGPLTLRRRRLALDAVKHAKSGVALDEAVSNWLTRVSPDFGDVLDEQISLRATKLVKDKLTSRDAALLIPLVPDAERDALVERYQALAATEAHSGGIKEARAFLNAPDFDSHPSRSEIQLRLVTLCKDAYPIGAESGEEDLLFYSSLLAEMCIRNTETLGYRIAIDPFQSISGGRVDNVADAVPQIAEVATVLAEALGRPIAVKPRQSDSPLIELKVEGYAALGSMTYPCTLDIKRLYKAEGPQTLHVKGTCMRIIDID